MGCRLSKANASERSFRSTLNLDEEDIKFMEIVRLRKEERKVRTEKQRREVFEHLEERRWRNEEEIKNKLFGLPDEVWEQILGEMSDLKDLWSMWQVHPTFRSLSGESQTQEVLLSQLLSIKILPHLWEDDKARMSKLMMCRTFSKGMRTSVDRLIETDFMESLSDGHASRNQSSYRFKLKIYDMRSLDGLLANFVEGPTDKRAKRVFLRTIHLFPFRGEENRDRIFQFKEKVTLLKLIGDQVWHVGFHFSLKDEGFLHLQEWVGLMLNLRWIEMNLSPVMASKTFPLLPSPENHLFPFLRHLERVSLRLFELDGYPKLIHQLTLSNLHIKRLDLDETRYTYDDKNYESVLKITHLLSRLNLNAFLGSWFPSTIKILQAVPYFEWELRSLSLTLHDESWEMSAFINIVNNISTLEHLSLHFRWIRILEDEQIPCLKLPNLETVDINFESCKILSSLESVKSFLSPEFLLHSKNLKTIYWLFVGSDIAGGYSLVVENFFKDFVRIRHNSLTSSRAVTDLPFLALNSGCSM